MQTKHLVFISAFILLFSSILAAQSSVVQKYDSVAVHIAKEALGSNNSYTMLEDLCTKVGYRISGSPQAAKAVQWAMKRMQDLGFENVHLEPVMVPHWVRGPVEEAYLLLPSGQREKLKITTLGGSIATPAEGITAEIVEVKSFDELRALGVRLAKVTLHVGRGTFRPVTADDARLHPMLPEHYRMPEADAALVARTAREGGRVLSVGTTSTRALETLARQAGGFGPGEGWTSLYIYPGHEFRVVGGLITNFHLPKSTPLFLAAAFVGRLRLLSAYQEAFRERYRLYSYGDAMLIL